MRVAIAHPWFVETGGAEKVVGALAMAFPGADIYTLAADPACVPPVIQQSNIYTSVLNPLLASRLRYRRASFMALFPWAVKTLHLSHYDLVISSCGPAMMGVPCDQTAKHICYFHTPHRAWWDLYATRQSQLGWLRRQVFTACASRMRNWEFDSTQKVDYVISNSQYISKRVYKYLCRESTVIYPPVDTSIGYLTAKSDDYYLSIARLDTEKRIDLVIRACNQLKRRLVVVGTGREEAHLKAMAGATISFAGRVSDDSRSKLYANCRAYVFAGDEDFGIAPVEAQAFGRPVIAYGHGGLLETMEYDANGLCTTGVLFLEQTVPSVVEAIVQFESDEHTFNPLAIQRHARRFDTSVFIDRMQQFVECSMQKESAAYAKHECFT
jgi:glycosyltransferase involved in cell wall biosynthesis